MIEALALRMAQAIKRAEPEKTASVEVMKFSLEALLNIFVTLFFVVVVGALTGKLAGSLVGLASFAVLRFFSGGIHLRTAVQCSFVSTVLISAAPHIPLSQTAGQALTVLSLISMLAFAPSNIEDHARIPKKYFPVLKLISAVIVSLGFFLGNSTFIVVCFIQALTILPVRTFLQRR